MDDSAIKRACEAVGGQVKLAALIKVSAPAINQWVTKGRVPAERVLAVEAASGIPRHELRPDLYPFAQAGRRAGEAAA